MNDDATNISERPPKEGLRQLLTIEALRTLIRNPRVFIANIRQGPEFIRDQRRRHDLAGLEEFIEPEASAVAAVLEIEPSAYEAAAKQTWLPTADPKDPLTVWNARAELLRIVGTITTLMKPEVLVETGVALGFTTATILRAMKESGVGHVYSVDLPALQYNPDDPVGRAIPEELKDRWTLRLGDSRKLLEPLCSEVGPLDVFIHDALHTYSSQMREYKTAWPHIRPGGLLVSDDVNNPAFIEFAESVGARPHLVAGPSRSDAIGLLRKP